MKKWTFPIAETLIVIPEGGTHHSNGVKKPSPKYATPSICFCFYERSEVEILENVEALAEIGERGA